MMQVVFWLSAAFILYVYVGYPLLLVVWSKLSRRPGRPPVAPLQQLPSISIVIAVRNEARRLAARIENLLSLDYPAERQIIVVSDGSTDDTRAALAGAPPIVELICEPARGKAAALNVGVAHARHDIVVFADARQTFAPDALRALVAPFADGHVGGVTGELLLDSEAPTCAQAVDAASPMGEGVGLYWRYEKVLRRLESTIASTVGATGAIYALRRSAWQPLPEGTILDDVLAPMRAVLAGWSIAFDDRAKAFDHGSWDSATEARRKVRTLAGNVQILWLEPRLLLPFVNPVWLQYVSHKVGRLVVPYALVTLLVSNLALAREQLIYALALAAQCAFYLLAAYGAWLARDSFSSPPLGVQHHAPDA
jgi:poly-beta-1,6-N-acetyl-D-glucosamine synthase